MQTEYKKGVDITVIDAAMGSGKTTYIFDYINQCLGSDPFKHKFLYVSPFLTEVGDGKITGRIHEACPEADFKSPLAIPSKRESLKFLLANGYNISCTHRLYEEMDLETAQLLNEQGYTVVIDEALAVIQSYEGLAKADLDVLKHHLKVDEKTYRVEWTSNDVSGAKYENVKRLCDEERLVHFKGKMFIWELPPAILTASKKTIILTYLFRSSLLYSYFNKYSIPFTYADNKSIGLRGEAEVIAEAKGLIELVDSPTVKKLGKCSMTVTGYSKLTPAGHKKIKTMVETVVRNSLKLKGPELIWTTFKEHENSLKGKGFTKSFVACSTRATNNYGERQGGVYLVDRYFNAFLNTYLENCGVAVDDDLYGLSEMLQWIWRLRIRNGQSIKLVIPSQRMRGLLTDWLDGKYLVEY